MTGNNPAFAFLGVALAVFIGLCGFVCFTYDGNPAVVAAPPIEFDRPGLHVGGPPTVLDDPGQFDAGTLKVVGAVCEVVMADGGGSGALVGFTRDDKAVVLSCRHVCIETGRKATVSWPSGATTSGTVVHVEPSTRPITRWDGNWETDLALIVCDRPPGIEPAPVAEFCGQCGPFVAVGWRHDQIRVAFAEQAHVEGGAIKTSAPFVAGQSGGALFDRYGRLIGVTVATGEGYGISALPQDLLRRFTRPHAEFSSPRDRDKNGK